MAGNQSTHRGGHHAEQPSCRQAADRDQRQLPKVAGTPAELALRAQAAQVANATSHERYLNQRRTAGRKAKEVAASQEHYCFVCWRPTDHVGDHDDLVAAGKASYDSTPQGNFVRDIAGWRPDGLAEEIISSINWDLTHPVVARP